MATDFKDNFTGHFEGDANVNIPLRFLTASSIVADKVWDKDGKHMGHIKDIMLDLKESKIEYYVIEFGGFLGIGEKFFAIPVNRFEVDPEHKVFRFKGSKDELAKAPGFDKHHWPETNEHAIAYTRLSYSYWDNPD